MMTIVNLPDGSVQTTSALSPLEIQEGLQDLTLQLLGTKLPALGATQPQMDAVYSKVRVNWPPQGQPSWGINEDVCFLSAVTENAPNLLLRNEIVTSSAGVATTTQMYGRYWRVRWTFYGPNSSVEAGVVHGALLSGYVSGALRGFGVGLIPDFQIPSRVPELFNAQWWERSDLVALVSETVTTSITVGTVENVPIVVSLEAPVLAGYGDADYGSGQYGAGYALQNQTLTASAKGPS